MTDVIVGDKEESVDELSVETKHVESDEEPDTAELSVTTEHREELSRREYDTELVKRIAEVNDLSPSYVAGLRNVQLDMSELSVSPEDFPDDE